MWQLLFALSIISALGFMLSWFFPNLFISLFRNRFTKSGTRIMLIFLAFVFFLFSAVISPQQPPDKKDSHQPQTSEADEQIKNESENKIAETQPEQAAATEAAPENAPSEEQKKQEPGPELKKEEQSSQPANPVDKIPVLLKEFSNLEITVWDSKNNFAKATTPSPYEVIVNAGNGKIASCYYAKISAFEIMKILYSDNDVKDKLSRVLFTSWGHLRVSVGSDDGTKTEWKYTGPTNFWTVMMKYKPYEDETGPLNQRTWGKYIDSECY